MNKELESMQKPAGTACFKVLTKQFASRIEEKHKTGCESDLVQTSVTELQHSVLSLLHDQI